MASERSSGLSSATANTDSKWTKNRNALIKPRQNTHLPDYSTRLSLTREIEFTSEDGCAPLASFSFIRHTRAHTH
ncbi:hypothetical protein QQF64_004947 [Cirrhinus molitorella]|uniref:Uncharacterized protein n=1 Tax=Cirrhinus molitorella TaxID=172907 RepID=A0ABR3MHQ3_9TELE